MHHDKPHLLRPSAAEVSRFNELGLWRNRAATHFLHDRAQSEPERVLVIDRGHLVSAARLDADALALAAEFVALGLEPGDVISFQLPNWSEALVINAAAALTGLVCNPLVPIYRDAEVRFMLADSGSKLLFIPAIFRNYDYLSMSDRLRGELPALRDVVLVGDSIHGRTHLSDMISRGAARDQSLPPFDPNAVKLRIYTSGTTGPAKAVLHSSNTLMAEIDAVIAYWRLTVPDVMLMPSPVTHITGYLYALELPLVSGLPVVLMERWNADIALDLIDLHRATITIGATPFLQELVEAAEAQHRHLPSLRLFACGGAPVAPALIYRTHVALQRCVACRVYGSTEAPTITLGVVNRDEERLAATTDGRVVGHEVRVVDAKTGAPLANGEEGEITVHGPELFLGYGSPEQTAACFSPDGYFQTGDLGRLVGDCLLITGRKKDLIIRGGENISPKEIEDVLSAHPAVREIAVVAMPNARLGEGVCAYVVPHQDAVPRLTDLTELLAAAGLARQKWPERLEVVETLPRTPSGKIRKDVLRTLIAKALQSSET